MIFIFGYHPVNKTIGPIEEKDCPNCHNLRHWLLSKSIYYISFFFLPLIPTKTDYFQRCPVCKFSEQLSHSDFYAKEPLAKLNNEALNSDMSEEEYEKRLRNIHL